MNNKKNIFLYLNLILVSIIILSVGYSAFQNNLKLSKVAAVFRVEADIRITDFSLLSASNAVSESENYNKDLIYGTVNLTNSDSYIDYTVKITNIGNIEEGILSILGNNDNLDYELIDYNLGDKICETKNSITSCKLGIEDTITIRIKWASGKYDSSNTEQNFTYTFDFEYYNMVTYNDTVKTYISNCPSYIINGGTLTFNYDSTGSDYLKIYKGGIILEDSEYTYINNVVTINGVDANISIGSVFPVFHVTNESELNTALTNAKTSGGGEIIFDNDIALTSNIFITDVQNLTIDLNTYTLSADLGESGAFQTGVFNITGTSDVVIKNGTVTNDYDNVNNVTTSASYAYHNFYVSDSASLEVEDITATNGNVPLRSDSSGNVNAINCTFTSSKWAGINNAGTGTMNLYNSTITGVNIGANNTNAGSSTTGKMNIYNSTVTGTVAVSGTGASVYSGSYSTDPSSYLATGSVSTLNSETNYYDVIEVETHTITYILNGGTLSTSVTTFTNQEEVTLPTPIKSGFSFSGWYSDEDLTIEYNTIPSGTNEDVTVYAKWEENTTEAVTASSASELTSAISDIGSGEGTIELTSDIALGSSPLTLSSGGNITINLGSNSITSSNISSGSGLIEITNGTNVTLTSTTGILESNRIGVYNKGTGTVVLDVYNISSTDDVGVRNSSTGTIYINNSTITCSKWAGVNNNNNGTIIINNSSITGGNYSVRNNGTSGTITINSGTFSTSGNGTFVKLIGDKNITINGGNFQNVDTSFQSYVASGLTYSNTTTINGNIYYVVE